MKYIKKNDNHEKSNLVLHSDILIYHLFNHHFHTEIDERSESHEKEMDQCYK